MMRKSLVAKLFAITLVFFTILLLANFAVQRVFLQEYYMEKKSQTLESRIEAFSKEYAKGSWSKTELLDQMDRFAQENNVPLLITDDAGEIIDKTVYGNMIAIKSDTGVVYTAYMEQWIANKDHSPKVGDKIELSGSLFMEEKIFRDILKLEVGNETYFNDELIKSIHDDIEAKKFPLGMQLVEIEGEIVFVNENMEQSTNTFMTYKTNLLIAEIENVFSSDKLNLKDMTSGEIIRYEFSDPSYNNKNRVFIKRLNNPDDKATFIFAMTPFQPIDEAIEIIEGFNIYVFLLAFVLVIVLSGIYAKLVARPLLQFNQVIEKMANLDFTAKCEIHSEDELGNLASNVNVLSSNLEESLNALQLANDKLLDDIEKERRQEAQRRQFVADLSHELKTPLGVIRGYAEGVAEGVSEEKRAYYLNVIVREIEKMNGLVVDMLKVSELQSVGYKLNLTDFYIGKSISRMAKKYSQLIEDKSIVLNVSIDSDVMVHADKEKIEIVIDNLISNAVKYTEFDEQINLNMNLEAETVGVSVENTGVQIPEAEIDKIWDRFYRLERSRNRMYGGSGLGLNIVRSILEMHESPYGVENTQRGVCFYFSLKRGTDN